MGVTIKKSNIKHSNAGFWLVAGQRFEIDFINKYYYWTNTY